MGFVGSVVFTIAAVPFLEGPFRKRRLQELLQSALGDKIRLYNIAVESHKEVIRESERMRRAAERTRLETQRARQAAEQAERRKRIDYWRSLRDTEFEDELATLYRSMGYSVQTTSTTGDDGIDLILTKEGKTTIVQCKGQKNRATPAKVRELSGSRDLFKSKRGFSPHHTVFACTKGYTRGAKDTAKELKIRLITATEIARMAENVAASHPKQASPSTPASSSIPDTQSDFTRKQQQLLLGQKTPASREATGPRCPMCGSVMVLQSTKYDRFWRCSRFPNCKAIQNVDKGKTTPNVSTAARSLTKVQIEEPERRSPKKPLSSKPASPRSRVANLGQLAEDICRAEGLSPKEQFSKTSTGRKCPYCGQQMTLYDKFWLCSGFPSCKAIRNTDQSKFTPTTSTTGHGRMGIPTKQPERTTPKKPNSRLPTGPQCPSCGSAMALMDLWRGRYGKLWGCPRYPECKGARDLNRRVLRY